MTRASLFVCLIGCLTLLGCKDNGLPILDSRDLAGADLAGVHDMAGCEGATRGASCDVPGKYCGECQDVCHFCNILKCDNGKWTDIEIVPGTCQDMTPPPVCMLGNDPLPCSASNDCPQGATCNAGSCACVNPVCTQGQDQTCNDDSSMSSLSGHCNSAGACDCLGDNVRNPQTGKCAACPPSVPATPVSCSTPGLVCNYPGYICNCAQNGASSSWQCVLEH